MPEEFLWDPQTKSFGDPGRRPELQETTIEYIAPTEYMVYIFLINIFKKSHRPIDYKKNLECTDELHYFLTFFC